VKVHGIVSGMVDSNDTVKIFAPVAYSIQYKSEVHVKVVLSTSWNTSVGLLLTGLTLIAASSVVFCTDVPPNPVTYKQRRFDKHQHTLQNKSNMPLPNRTLYKAVRMHMIGQKQQQQWPPYKAQSIKL